MLKYVIKNNGSEELFELGKMISSIELAFKDRDRQYNDNIIDFLAVKASSNFETDIKSEKISSKDISKSIDTVLRLGGYEDVADSYLNYRHNKYISDSNTLIDYKKLVNDYLDESDWRVKENSTVTHTLGGLILSNSGAVTANYWLSEVYDEEIAEAHRNADIHIHDLCILSGYCAGWSLKQLIQEGLGGVPGRITSSPASHLATLCNQMVNFLGCFTDDTKIILADGSSLTIREMLDSGKKEWLVKSYDPKTDSVINAKMYNLHKTRETEELLEIEFEDGDIVKCTPDHKFYTLNRGWVEAQFLTEEDELPKLEKRKMFVYKTTNTKTGDFYIGSHITYNLNDGYLGSGTALKKQIDKFGEKYFRREILCFCSNNKELRESEVLYIKKYCNNAKCLNKVRSLNRGFDLINGPSDDAVESKNSSLYGVLVYKDGKALYINYSRLNEFLNSGYIVISPEQVTNDGKREYIDGSGKYAGLLTTEKTSFGMIGKEHTDETKEKIKAGQEKTKEQRSKNISIALNKIGEDGLTVSQRTQRHICENGKTHHENIMEKQMQNGNNNFIKNNPNYIIQENGFSVPHNTNIKRVKNGTHNFVTTAAMGCHNKTLEKRIPQILEYFGNDLSWTISEAIFKDFLSKFPDWTGKLTFEGFVYTCKKAIKKYPEKQIIVKEV